MQSTETTNSASTSMFIECDYISNFPVKLLISLHNYFTELEDKDNNIKIPTTPNKVSGESDVVLRRTHSFETDEK